jgi:hypothetical protein
VDAYGDPVITALNLSEGTLVKTSDNQDITATGSGVLGAGTVTMDASGNITGNIFTLGGLNITAVNNVDVNALGLGPVVIVAANLGPSIIVGIQGVSATGDTSGASLLSNNQVSGGQNSMAAGTAADAASQGAASETSTSPAKNDDTTATDDDVKKKGKAAATVQKKGRVTVLLPPKNLSQNQTSSNHL